VITEGRRTVWLEDRPTTVFILAKVWGAWSLVYNRYIRQPIVPWPPAWPTFVGLSGWFWLTEEISLRFDATLSFK